MSVKFSRSKLPLIFFVFPIFFNLIAFAGNLSSLTASTTKSSYQSNVKRIFITSTSYTGNLGGLAGADAKCMARAAAAGLSGTFIAMVNTTTQNLNQRFVFPDGIIVVNTKNQIIWKGGIYIRVNGGVSYAVQMPWASYNGGSGYIFTPVYYNELGAVFSGQTWTGDNGSGVASVYNCNNWTDGVGAYSGTVSGNSTSDTSNSWLSAATYSCNNSYYLYCLEI